MPEDKRTPADPGPRDRPKRRVHSTQASDHPEPPAKVVEAQNAEEEPVPDSQERKGGT
jgi:hypothetical protein